MVSETGAGLVFLLGVPRSGTTLLSALLDEHPDVCCPPEPWLAIALDAVGLVPADHPAEAPTVGRAVSDFLEDASRVEAVRAFAARAYSSRMGSASVLVDKTPRYWQVLDRLEAWFPEAKYLVLRRDPFDVAASCLKTWGLDLAGQIRRGEWSPHALDLALGVPRLEAFAERMGDRALAVSYERLVAAPAEVLERVHAFLGVPALVPAAGEGGAVRLGEGVKRVTARLVGDKKILETGRVHSDSVGSGLRELGDERLRVIDDVVGRSLLAAMGYAGTAEALRSRGLEAASEARTAELRGAAESALAEQWARAREWSDAGKGLPPAARALVGDAEARAAAAEGELARERQELTGRVRFLEHEVTRLVAAGHAAQQRALGEADRRAKMQGLLLEAREARAAAESRLAEIEDASHGLRARHKKLEEQLHLMEWQLQGVMSRTARAHFAEGTKLLVSRAIHRFAPRGERPYPTITVVTPCLNAAGTIEQTVLSVLEQGYPRLQYIVVDGGSTDGTLAVLEKYRPRLAAVITGADAGMYDAIAEGFGHAVGEVMGYLNADDTLEPGALWKIGEHFRDHPETKIAYHEDTIECNGWRFPNRAQPRVDLLKLLGGHILFQDGVWWRREVYRAAGGPDRALRLAGDYDLWLRLGRHGKFTRLPGHVSCFRKRPGQLSERMEAYEAERRAARDRALASLPAARRLRMLPMAAVRRAADAAEAVLRPRRLWYPLDPHPALPPVDSRPQSAVTPRCPLTNRPPDRLLFSSPDTRFGEPVLTRFYYCEGSDTVVASPELSREELMELYQRHYSRPRTEPRPPAPGLFSPYQRWRGGARWRAIDAKVADRLRLPPKAANWVNRHQLKDWAEVSLDELFANLRGLADPRDAGVRFLEVGCFNGDLLDRIRERTRWTTAGVEPNPEAAEEARRRGHAVHTALAEECWRLVPEGERYDVVFLGQVIEHIERPYDFARRIRHLMPDGGLLVLSTPNLDSRQIDLFGPTWSHWHPPYHRVLFGRRGLRLLGERSGFRLARMRSYSNSNWTLLSRKLNEFGLGGSVPHDWSPPPEELARARSLAAWSKLLWDWRGLGDYSFAVFRAE